MYKAFGIVSSSGRNIYVDGMQDYRPIGAFSFLGRYRVIDFPISNMTNSNIERIQVYINNKPRSVVEHLGTGRHYNINSKSGKLQLLFSEHNNDNDIYNTDISCYLDNSGLQQAETDLQEATEPPRSSAKFLHKMQQLLMIRLMQPLS